ncbi:MAG TPA: hypothetical protein VGL11_06390 [Candidatus Binatia bacterium]|jgi:membrane protein implicated in regulation of membrane protease activity
MLRFTIDKDPDPEGASVRRLLEAHLTYAKMSAAKSFCLHLLAIVSAAVWVGAMWPGVLPLQLLDSALALWLALLFFAVLTSIEEWLWHRKVARYRSERRSDQKESAA